MDHEEDTLDNIYERRGLTLVSVLFCLNLTSFPTISTLQDKHNIRTLSLNIKFICTRCFRHEKLAKGSLFCLFLKLVELNIIFTDNVRILYMYVFVSKDHDLEIKYKDVWGFSIWFLYPQSSSCPNITSFINFLCNSRLKYNW